MEATITNTGIPGAQAASAIRNKLRSIGIKDVQLFYDKNIKPKGMWAVVQIERPVSTLIMPASYTPEIKPYILWWCKNEKAQYRDPSERDLRDIITVVTRAPKIWAEGEKRADKFEAQDAEKDRKHQEKFKQKIHEIAPAMKKALKKGNL